MHKITLNKMCKVIAIEGLSKNPAHGLLRHQRCWRNDGRIMNDNSGARRGADPGYTAQKFGNTTERYNSYFYGQLLLTIEHALQLCADALPANLGAQRGAHLQERQHRQSELCQHLTLFLPASQRGTSKARAQIRPVQFGQTSHRRQPCRLRLEKPETNAAQYKPLALNFIKDFLAVFAASLPVNDHSF